MLTLPLAPTDDRANPAFKDAAGCAKWLAQLQLTNLHQAHAALRTQLDELNRYPMRGLERLHTMELLRETVAALQTDYAKKLAIRKLPLSESELTVFVSIIALWQSMVSGYQRCLQSHMAGDTLLVSYGALLCQRCLTYSGLQIFEHLRMGYEFDGKLWQQLHALYAFCEEQDWLTQEISDPPRANLRASKKTARSGTGPSCNATYIKVLLACYADWAELTRQQLQILDRWLTLWSPTLTLEHGYTASKEDAQPLALDLVGTLGLQPLKLVQRGSSVRYLNMAPLSKLLRVKSILLQQGHTPQQLELGNGCNSADCGWLLNCLHQYWCEERGNRALERQDAAVQAQMCYSLDGCFAYITNRPFKQPSGDRMVDTLSRKQIAAFGHVLSDTDRHDLAQMGFMLETWQVQDESVRGARLLRAESSGIRLGVSQLVALRTLDANGFMTGTVSWVKVTQNGQLHAGVRYLPGIPQAISMKATGINISTSNLYVATLLLPPVLALKSPASLIIPREWFKPGRVVELILADKTKMYVQMQFSVEKGVDYERISFSESSAPA